MINSTSVKVALGERAVVTKDEAYVSLLTTGTHTLPLECSVEKMAVSPGGLYAGRCPAKTLLADSANASELMEAPVPLNSVGIVLVDGAFRSVLHSGRHALWTLGSEVEVRVFRMEEPLVSGELLEIATPENLGALVNELTIAGGETGVFLCGDRPPEVLGPGNYTFWTKCSALYTITWVDTRLQQLLVSGQELLTRDKVTIRLNAVCTFRVTDPIRAVVDFRDHEEQIRTLVQLALRCHTGSRTLDELLAGRDELASEILASLKEKEADYAVSFADVGVKDVILPGEIRNIMNSVLVAEKQAQANVIARREEVASTRSLLNTAKLLDENPTLKWLKELETLEKVCRSVGSLNVSDGADLLEKLRHVVSG